MLSSKGLYFDIIGLQPGLEIDGSITNAFMFNYEPNVFETTMEFKTCFIINDLSQVPTLKNSIIWNDRASHICVFQTYLSTLVSHSMIDTGKVICVKPSRPKYNPQWGI